MEAEFTAAIIRTNSLLRADGRVTNLQQQLGHADLATTQLYAAGLSERRRDAVLAMDFGKTKAAKGRAKRGE